MGSRRGEEADVEWREVQIRLLTSAATGLTRFGVSANFSGLPTAQHGYTKSTRHSGTIDRADPQARQRSAGLCSSKSPAIGGRQTCTANTRREASIGETCLHLSRTWPIRGFSSKPRHLAVG